MDAFPPILSVRTIDGDPFAAACAAAADEAEPARLTLDDRAHSLSLALELAPQMPLAQAVTAVPALFLGVADAIGALSPPEIGVFCRWPQMILVNGAVCGRLEYAADTHDADAEPDWLVVGATLALAATAPEPGKNPDQTTLADEGSPLTPASLAPAIARHALSWLYTLEHEGPNPVLSAFGAKLWRERDDGWAVAGLDDTGGLILKAQGRTRIEHLLAALRSR